jgi:hypothetical protein
MYIKQERDQAVDDASYRAFKDFFMKGNARCSVFSEQSAAPALPGYIGRLYRLHCDEFNTNMTLFGNLHWGQALFLRGDGNVQDGVVRSARNQEIRRLLFANRSH